VIAWDLAGTRRLGEPFAVSPRRRVRTISETGVATGDAGSYNVAVTPDGDTLAATQRSFVNLVDSRTLRIVGRIRATDGEPAAGVGFAPDGRTLAVTGADG
jgi:hypothetical protein